MILHGYFRSSAAYRVRIALNLKGLPVEHRFVHLRRGEQRAAAYVALNPQGLVPTLEVGERRLTQSLAIIEYLEELHPTPPMLGKTPQERARIRELERIADLSILSPIATIFQNTHPFMAGRLKQSADAAENARNRLAANLKVLDAKVQRHPFAAGERPSIADCTLMAAFEFAEFAQVPIDPSCGNLARWHASFKQRPSASA